VCEASDQRKRAITTSNMVNHNNMADVAKIFLVYENSLSEKQKHGIDELQKQCFRDVDPREVDECFYAESFARILAYHGKEIIGHLRLFRRNTDFDAKSFVLGGVGGVCVAKHKRRKGVATKMIKRGLKILKQEKCDVACLNADLSKSAYKVYEKIGFQLMSRAISFEDVNGKLRYDNGTMFIPVCSKEIYEYIMNSGKTFHYGKGYW
jgi:predicted GNAT family N-acyltransferase